MPPVVQARNPLRNYQFRIAVISASDASPTAYVAGAKSVSGLRVQINPFETWEGGNNLHRYANPNKVVWEPVTIEQGLALDTTFEDWAQAALDYSTGLKPSTPVKRQVFIDLWDENSYPDGPPVLAAPAMSSLADTVVQFGGPRCRRYHLKNAWISKYAPLPKLDSMGAEVALLSVELVHEGWSKEDIS